MNRRHFLTSLGCVPFLLNGINVSDEPTLFHVTGLEPYVGIFTKSELISMGFNVVDTPAFVDENNDPKIARITRLRWSWLSEGDIIYWTKKTCINYSRRTAEMELKCLKESQKLKYVMNVYPLFNDTKNPKSSVGFYVRGCK